VRRDALLVQRERAKWQVCVQPAVRGSQGEQGDAASSADGATLGACDDEALGACDGIMLGAIEGNSLGAVNHTLCGVVMPFLPLPIRTERRLRYTTLSACRMASAVLSTFFLARRSLSSSTVMFFV